MNLYDVVKRHDRMLEVGESNPVEAIELKLPGGGQRAVRIQPGHAGLLLKDAHEVTVLRSFPALPGWTLHLAPDAELEIWLETKAGRHRVFAGKVSGEPIRLTWPIPVPMQFDLRLVAINGEVTVAVGPLFNARERIIPLLKGRGVEVGPGANPAILPSDSRDMTYVERMSMDQWAMTYAKKTLDRPAASHWDRYTVDSAHHLDGVEDGTVDFIFSSHVFEHLVNPLGVLHNWWQRLAPGGVIAGVVPDARYTFDLRQPLTPGVEFEAQESAGGYEPDDAMYEKWCRHTAPYNTPDDLKARNYSIHINYFSVETFRGLLDTFSTGRYVSGIFMESVLNGKDFGFLIAKR